MPPKLTIVDVVDELLAIERLGGLEVSARAHLLERLAGASARFAYVSRRTQVALHLAKPRSPA
jgi:hypothetical protein